MAQDHAHPFEPRERPHRCQHLRRVRPLRARVLSQFRSRACAKTRSSTRCSARTATKRVRNSESTVWSKPGSVSSKLRAYFHSSRLRTASAACRSGKPAMNCSTVTCARRPGASAGCPRVGKRSAKSSSL
jgi:hypothetical protein